LRQPLFNVDPTRVAESANKLDFLSSVNPDLVTKALGGDPAAFADVINSAVRQAVVGITVNQGQLLNSALAENNQRITSSLPNQLKQVQLNEVGSDNPVFSHPAVAPLVTALKQTAYQKNPNASVGEVNQLVNNYLSGLAVAMQDASPEAVKQKQQAAKTAGEQDWSSLFS
jgi:hypothetical protein